MHKVIQCVVLIMVFVVTVPVYAAYAAYDMTADDLYSLGRKYEYIEKNYEKAAELYSEVIKKDPNYKNIYSSRAIVYIHLKKYDLALLDETKAIELKPNTFGLYFKRGHIYNAMGKYDIAIRDYTQAISIEDLFFARKARGEAYVKIHNYDLAMDDFNRMAEQKPKDINVFVCKSQLYALLGDYEKAQEISQEGANINTDYPIIFFILGQSNEILGNKDEAMDCYQKASDIWDNRPLKKEIIEEIKAKIDARLVGDWDSYKDWIYY
jgi:tetratricopeptide (TPR) repeat protein